MELLRVGLGDGAAVGLRVDRQGLVVPGPRLQVEVDGRSRPAGL